MSAKDEIFEGKSFKDLTKDIYKNTKDRKVQIDLLISEIHGFITTIDDVIMIAPIIKAHQNNGAELVKLAGVLQRIISKSTVGDEESLLLSDSEKEDLINALQSDVEEIQREHDKIQTIKDKSENIIGN